MTRKEGILIASRTLAVFLAVSALLSALVLPVEIINSIRSGFPRMPGNGYFIVMSQMTMALSVLRILLQAVIARVLWTCNPWVERILGGSCENEEGDASSE
jgi:hypothetical protein